MYGSVSVNELIELLFNEGITVTKKQLLVTSPIKTLGTHKISISLPEDISASISLEVNPDRIIEKKVVQKEVKAEVEAEAEDATENADKETT